MSVKNMITSAFYLPIIYQFVISFILKGFR